MCVLGYFIDDLNEEIEEDLKNTKVEPEILTVEEFKKRIKEGQRSFMKTRINGDLDVKDLPIVEGEDLDFEEVTFFNLAAKVTKNISGQICRRGDSIKSHLYLDEINLDLSKNK